MFLLWHPSLTAINLSYTFPILETSATALCGTTGSSSSSKSSSSSSSSSSSCCCCCCSSSSSSCCSSSSSSSRSDLHLCVPTAMRIVEHIGKSWDSLHESPEEGAVHCVALWTRVTLLSTCEVCTEAVHCVALWTRVTFQVWACVKYVPKQSIA